MFFSPFFFSNIGIRKTGQDRCNRSKVEGSDTNQPIPLHPGECYICLSRWKEHSYSIQKLYTHKTASRLSGWKFQNSHGKLLIESYIQHVFITFFIEYFFYWWKVTLKSTLKFFCELVTIQFNIITAIVKYEFSQITGIFLFYCLKINCFFSPQIANIGPADYNFDETISTLRWMKCRLKWFINHSFIPCIIRPLEESSVLFSLIFNLNISIPGMQIVLRISRTRLRSMKIQKMHCWENSRKRLTNLKLSWQKVCLGVCFLG